MELKECITCGSHNFTDNKCDYCGNEYETTEPYDDEVEDYVKDLREYPNKIESTKIDFQETPEGKKLLKVMILILVSIIWFAICVFIPPLFLITICGLIILSIIKKIKKININI